MKFRPITPRFPKIICVETSSYCNLACEHCIRDVLVKSGRLAEGFMDFDLYKKIINEISQYKNAILRPLGRGEPLINPDFPDMIRYAKKRGVYIWLNTNGVLLSPKISRELLEAGIDRIEVSIDAATPEMFLKTKGKDIYEKVVSNTIECCRLKNESYPDSEVVVSFVETEINTSEKDDFVKFWSKYADRVNVRPVHQAGALLKDLRVNKRKNEEERYPCEMLWQRIEITHQGHFKYCELDWENRSIIGDVRNLSIKEIWNGEKHRKLRELHIERRFSEIPLCDVCKSYHEISSWKKW